MLLLYILEQMSVCQLRNLPQLHKHIYQMPDNRYREQSSYG